MEINKKDWKGQRLDVSSAWKGLENYIPSIIENYKINTNRALEFGVDLGYSTHILSQIFNEVIGVDSFIGDNHIIHQQGDEFYEKVSKTFENTNVKLIRKKYEEFIKDNNEKYDLIHIDIVHYYKETYECAEWSLHHSDVVILHDTQSFLDVKNVCLDLQKKYNINFHNIIEHHGLGILSKI